MGLQVYGRRFNSLNNNVKWVCCPICNSKTRVQVRKYTELISSPIFCPKCKKETLVNVKVHIITIAKEPDA
ncbi:cysteine-rich KTR domain-containing protein [Clostridioides difficile]